MSKMGVFAGNPTQIITEIKLDLRRKPFCKLSKRERDFLKGSIFKVIKLGENYMILPPDKISQLRLETNGGLIF